MGVSNAFFCNSVKKETQHNLINLKLKLFKPTDLEEIMFDMSFRERSENNKRSFILIHKTE